MFIFYNNLNVMINQAYMEIGKISRLLFLILFKIVLNIINTEEIYFYYYLLSQ